ncbi:MAG: DUF4249 family protein [Bacteroidales bacterium]|nr:DUF4249 family protein [Bacteroidales bacterium]
MRKICYLIMVAALLAACDNPLEFKPASRADMLVLNGHLSTDEEWHTVYVAVSHTEYVSVVTSGELRCYVNGTLAAKTTDLIAINDDSYYATPGRYFQFKAAFKTGDLVRIEVDAAGFKASNEQIVPPMPTVTKVDTLTVIQRSDWGSVDTCYRFDTTLKDVDKEDSFFRLTIVDHNDAVYYKDDVEIGKGVNETLLSFFGDDDPILNEGHFNAADYFEIGSTNHYGVITDNMFAGGSATLKPVVSKNDFGRAGWMDEADSVKVSIKAIVKVYGLEMPYFYYFKALNSLRDGQSDLALEDVQIPDNIEGGIGFIGIANPYTASFTLGEYSYSLLYYYNDYPPLPE